MVPPYASILTKAHEEVQCLRQCFTEHCKESFQTIVNKSAHQFLN